MSRADASLFFRLASYRYDHGSISITANTGIKDWLVLFIDAGISIRAILDRLLHRSHVLNITGRSYRHRHLEHGARVNKLRALRPVRA